LVDRKDPSSWWYNLMKQAKADYQRANAPSGGVLGIIRIAVKSLTGAEIASELHETAGGEPRIRDEKP
jgi:hypothetical protein